jgi:hypothetical protein
VDTEPYDRIGAALDRFQEAHFWIHMMEEYYHHADQFRWFLNAFLKALKEVPDLVQMAMQNEDGFTAWFRERRTELRADPLIDVLSEKRDFVVHQSMLIPESSGVVGITEGRGFKTGITAPIHPLENSEDALVRLAQATQEVDFLGLTTPDEDSLPCVQREWRLKEFDEEFVDVCAKAWLRMGETLEAVLRWQGADPPPLSLDCRHDSRRVRMKVFDRDALLEKLK